MAFQVDFHGRLGKVRVSAASSLQAVFEAVANAFDATAGMGDKGRIDVRILRVPAQKTLFTKDDVPEYELAGFEIEDNGVGFTDENMAAFLKSDTTHKKSGKGVGRLLWLHVFDRAEVKSCYEQGGARFERRFIFSRDNHGVNDSETKALPAEPALMCGTKVRLLQPKKGALRSLGQTPGQLADKLLEHFLLHFTVMRGQSLTVMDDQSGEIVEVDDMYQDVIGGRHKEEEIDIRGHKFALHHLLVKPTVNRNNTINLCANSRLVTSHPLNELVPEVGRTVPVTVSAQGSFRYHGYVTGPYLDEIADDERTGLKFAPSVESGDGDSVNDSGFDLIASAGLKQEDFEGVSKRELFQQIAERSREHLAEFLLEVRRHKEKQLETFVASEQPQFRPFLELAKKNLDRLPARPSKKAIEIALYEAKIDGRQEMDSLVQRIIQDSTAHLQVKELRNRLVSQFVKAATDQNVSALAEYVCARKAVLKVFAKNLGTNSEDVHQLEEVIHNLIFPRFKTSNDLSPGYCDAGSLEIANLWLVDERLVFHQLLASDIPLKKLRGFLSDSAREPDVVIFDPAFATTDDKADLKTIALIEFKRPGRTQYSPGETKNPIDQIIALAKDIRKGTIESTDGRKRPVSKDVMIYAYIICDLTDQLLEIIENRAYRQTPDQKGYYFYHEPLNMTIEIISYEKLLRDAERRNEAFFRQLQLPC